MVDTSKADWDPESEGLSEQPVGVSSDEIGAPLIEDAVVEGEGNLSWFPHANQIRSTATKLCEPPKGLIDGSSAFGESFEGYEGPTESQAPFVSSANSSIEPPTKFEEGDGGDFCS